jgi:hypothetical protein
VEQIVELEVQLEQAQAVLAETRQSHENEREELRSYQEKMRGLGLSSSNSISSNSLATKSPIAAGHPTLDDELDVTTDVSLGETRTE